MSSLRHGPCGRFTPMKLGHAVAHRHAGQAGLFDRDQRTGRTRLCHAREREEARARADCRQRRWIADAQLHGAVVLHAGHRGRGVEPCGRERGDQAPLMQQPRVAVVVHVAGDVAGAHRKAARDAGRGTNLQPPLGGQDGRRARGVQIRADDQCPRPGGADRVQRGGCAAETFVHLELRVEPQTRQQHGGVAAFQQRHVAADQNDSFDRAAGNQRGTAGLDGKGDRVLVVTGHPVLGARPNTAGRCRSTRRRALRSLQT